MNICKGNCPCGSKEEFPLNEYKAAVIYDFCCYLAEHGYRVVEEEDIDNFLKTKGEK